MSKIWNRLAWTVLASVFLGMSIYLILNPTRTGVVPNYHFAAHQWWGGSSMYPGGTHGFLYAPPFAILFTPLTLVQPEIVGEILWRGLGFGLFAWGLWKLGSLISPSGRLGITAPAFVGIVLLAVPASLAALNNGQTNLPLSACLVLAALALRGQKWKSAAWWLCLALVLKPIALAPWLLTFAVLPAMRIPLAGGLLGVAFVGFLHPDPSYASAQWIEFFQKLLVSYTPENLRVSDIFGGIGKAGFKIHPSLEKGLRGGACLGALAWVWHAHRRQGMAGASWAIWVATALVFTVFNPRAETNSYVLVSPLLAYAALSAWQQVEEGKWKALVLATACMGLMCDGMGLWIYQATDLWFKPLLVLLVSPLLWRMPESWKSKA